MNLDHDKVATERACRLATLPERLVGRLNQAESDMFAATFPPGCKIHGGPDASTQLYRAQAEWIQAAKLAVQLLLVETEEERRQKRFVLQQMRAFMPAEVPPHEIKPEEFARWRRLLAMYLHHACAMDAI